MELEIYQVDAFASQVFAGNPAAVVPLEAWLDEGLMQKIAMENNLAETAFFVRKPGGGYHIRWFTPNTEIDLCGHATLASAWVLFHQLGVAASRVEFDSKSGILGVDRDGDLLALDFPSRPPQRVEPCAGLLDALGGKPREVWAARDYMIVYESEDELRALQPSMTGLMNIDRFAVIVTAKAESAGADFVSRFFAPQHGVPEDPVTGSSHSTLTPFWASRLGKSSLTAWQVSPRGGVLECEDRGARVRIAGRGVLYLKGAIFI